MRIKMHTTSKPLSASRVRRWAVVSKSPVLKEFMVCILLVPVVMALNWLYIKPEASRHVMEYIPLSESKPCWKGSNHTVMEINYKLWTAQDWNKQSFWNHISPSSHIFLMINNSVMLYFWRDSPSYFWEIWQHTACLPTFTTFQWGSKYESVCEETVKNVMAALTG